jgi:tRNA threonylcarbamoyladenosine biosynthesis protein TsaE
MLGEPPSVSRSPEETERAGAALAAGLAPGDVVLVSGELGAGKTTFVRGAARALGVTEPVTSPTFVVGHLYEAPGVRVAHLDLYRLGGLDDEDPGLLDPYFGPDVVTFVEWPERVGLDALLGERPIARRVSLAHAGGDRRRLEAT